MMKSKLWIPAITSITYIIMVIMNSLAGILPINGLDTGAISDSYPNLFAPAGITFAIWGVIYTLLFAFCIYLVLSYRKMEGDKREVVTKISLIFVISSLANTVWILAWHYRVIWFSLILMLVILGCLIAINLITKDIQWTGKEQLFIRLPFTVYFGWITVATIANITTLLVDLKWNRFNLSETFWSVAIIAIGALIGSVAIVSYKSIAYGIVIVWAYLGIIIKHTSVEAFGGQYPAIIVTVIISIIILIVTMGIMVGNKHFFKRRVG